jgi:hypothetical protein
MKEGQPSFHFDDYQKYRTFTVGSYTALVEKTAIRE